MAARVRGWPRVSFHLRVEFGILNCFLMAATVRSTQCHSASLRSPFYLLLRPPGLTTHTVPWQGEASSGTRILGVYRRLFQKFQVSYSLPSGPVEKAGQRHAPLTLLRKPLGRGCQAQAESASPSPETLGGQGHRPHLHAHGHAGPGGGRWQRAAAAITSSPFIKDLPRHPAACPRAGPGERTAVRWLTSANPV